MTTIDPNAFLKAVLRSHKATSSANTTVPLQDHATRTSDVIDPRGKLEQENSKDIRDTQTSKSNSTLRPNEEASHKTNSRRDVDSKDYNSSKIEEVQASKRRRSRSRSRDRRRRRRSYSRSRSRDHYRRKRSRSPPRSRSREYDRRNRHVRPRSRTPPPAIPARISIDQEMERLDRTVGVLQLAAKVRSRDLMEHFEIAKCGKVLDAKIVKDHRTGVSKGIGYVEFENIASVEKALMLSGTKIQGIPCIVQTTESEKRLLQQQAALTGDGISLKLSGPTMSTNSFDRRIYVGQLHFDLTEEDLQLVFDPFGPIESVQLHRDQQSGSSKGFAFIQYRNNDSARNAYEQMNGFELAGRQIRVGWVTEKNGGQNVKRSGPKDSNEEGLDDAEDVTLNVSRAELMKRLARDDDLFPQVKANESEASKAKAPSPPHQSRSAVPLLPPTRNCVLKNMFDVGSGSIDWAELKDDVIEECSRYGKIAQLVIDKNSDDGRIYLRFESIPSCAAVVKALSGRWFARKQIQTEFVVDAIFEAIS